MAAPSDRKTRPMLDRVREALFSILGERVEGAGVLDLFAGTGSLGIEALSRGARGARFLEQGRKPAGLLRKNLSDFGLEERGIVVERDALAPKHWGDGIFDLVFMDPPYPFMADPLRRLAVLKSVGELVRERLADGGVIVLHVPKRSLDEDEFKGLHVDARERVYGTTALWFLESLATDDEGDDGGEAESEAGP